MANSQEGREPSDGFRPNAVARLADVWQAARTVNGAELARALRRAGCDVRLAGPEQVSLFRDGVEVARLPLGVPVRAATLRALLRTLGVSAEKLAEYLLAWTEPKVP